MLCVCTNLQGEVKFFGGNLNLNLVYYECLKGKVMYLRLLIAEHTLVFIFIYFFLIINNNNAVRAGELFKQVKEKCGIFIYAVIFSISYITFEIRTLG